MTGLVVLLAGCVTVNNGGAPTRETAAPALQRAPTGADALLHLLPSGADIVAEIDVDRLRDNALAGPVLRSWADVPLSPEISWGIDPEHLAGIDAIVIAAYGVGTPQAVTLTVARGKSLTAVSGTRMLDDETMALGPASLLERVAALGEGDRASVAADARFMRLRAQAMPQMATGAALRITGRLSFEARVALSSMLRLDEVPAHLSVWGDVADDLAIIAMMGGSDVNEAARLARSAQIWRDNLAADTVLVRIGLHNVLRGAKITMTENFARAVFVIAPKRFRIVAGLLRQHAAEASP